MSTSAITVLLPDDSESWSAFADRIAATDGDVLVVLSGREDDLATQPEIRSLFFKECKKHAVRLRIATKHPLLTAEIRALGIRVVDRTKTVKQLLKDHELLTEVLRVFSPHLWRQQLTSRLQNMGLLSLPKLRVFSLVGLSAVLFLFVFFRLLPSAEVRVVPRQEPISQTMNVFLAMSGATKTLPPRVRVQPLYPLRIAMHSSLTFDQISKEFIGTPSKGEITVTNGMTEEYSLRTGTRFTNQAGMIFRTTEPLQVEAGKQVTVKVQADPLDLYEQIIGARGNIPAGVKWDIPGLSPEERKKVFGVNKKPLAGGTTAYRTVLKKEDLDLARKKLEEQLVDRAKEGAAEQLQELSQQQGSEFRILEYAELTKVAFSGFTVPTQFIGQTVNSVPVDGSVSYTAYAYNRTSILNMLTNELQSHIAAEKRLLPSSIDSSRVDVRVIDYNDDLTWIKLTVELLGTEEYILEPLSPNGALFGKKVREKIVGKTYEDALRIVKNMPEVDKVEISLWPPWSNQLPPIPSHISVVPQ